MLPLVKKTIMSQYANSPKLMRIIDSVTTAINPDSDIQSFYDLVFNLSTAQGFGLDVWGRIVGIPREMTFSEDDTGESFGFEEGFYPFNERPFSSGGFTTYQLSDEAYKRLILLKASANIIECTAPNINRLLKAVFDDRKCYFLITGHMRARFVFEFSLTAFERHLVYNTDILPRPIGVQVDVVDAIPPETFGFDGTGFQPFNEGTFYAG